MADYKVKFEVFEGPLDLLLYLIKKDEVDIYEVNLTRLATQFIEYIETMRLLDLEIAGEFLVMAATLMYIKSRELLPVDQRAEVEGDEEGEDPQTLVIEAFKRVWGNAWGINIETWLMALAEVFKANGHGTLADAPRFGNHLLIVGSALLGGRERMDHRVSKLVERHEDRHIELGRGANHRPICL